MTTTAPLTPADVTARRWAACILAGITMVAAALRFARLGQPCLWGDEALVYWRTCGTFAQLLRPLHEDGFPPLHYELYWTIVRLLGHAPSPAAMRAVPAACGTLLVPAVYLLARQLLPRHPSLWAAAFTACSAFALFYSRDAKMYAEAWLFMTASVGCLLWWLRTGRSTAWLGWVAAGAAAAGFQTLTLISVVGLSPLFLLTQRKAHWRQSLLWLAGVALIAAGPAGYYLRFNGWTDNVEGRGWQASGIAWVAAYNYGRTGPDQARYLATTFLTGWEWPRQAALDQLPPGRARALRGSAVAVLACVVAGALPWPARWRDRSGIAAIRRVVARFRGTDLPPTGRVPIDADRSPEPPWRSALWLSAWIALPLYGFYCRSVPGFATPLEAMHAAVDGVGHARVLGAALVVLNVALLVCQPITAGVRWWLAVAAVVAVVVGGGSIEAKAMAAAARAAADAGRPWASVWVPRYLGFTWPAVAIAAAALLARLPTRPLRGAAVALVLGVNLSMAAFRVFGSTEPPVDRMAADVWAAQPRDGHPSDTLTWTDMTDLSRGQVGPGSGNLFTDPGRYYLQILANRPMSPALFKDSLATFALHRGDPAGRLSRAVASAGPALRHVIAWEQLNVPGRRRDALSVASQGDDDVPAELPGWRCSADAVWTVRDAWTGQDVARYRRRAFDR